MADKPKTGTKTPSSALLPQHTRMAMGEKVTGQTLPAAPQTSKTPA